MSVAAIDPEVRRSLLKVEPVDARALRRWVAIVLGMNIPQAAVLPGHAPPFDYLCHAFFEQAQPRDCIVWANRGGGKTQLGAVATLLDLLFKPGIQIRILGGSFEQSSKMHRALRHMFEDDIFSPFLRSRITGRSIELRNGSRVEVLFQSQRSVRGQRVHRLRCDEIEHFHPEVWDAAQFVTRSGVCGRHFVHASIEVFSTMHRPFGLMQRLIDDAINSHRKVFRWNIIDTLEHCPDQRSCDTCPLFESCGGSARHARGFISIDDAIQQLRRVDAQTWQTEMLCNQPQRSDLVFPEFDPSVHVVPYNVASSGDRSSQWIAGVDFGYREPTVVLIVCHRLDDQSIHIVDELVMREMTVDQHIERVRAWPWPAPLWVAADPAGHQRSEHTGASTISLWKRAGFTLKTQHRSVESGLMAVRRRLRAADGSISLRIDPRCAHLIRSLRLYHYPIDKLDAVAPVKDGNDHAADALRYLITMLDRESTGPRIRTY